MVGQWTFLKLTVTKKGKISDSLVPTIKSTFTFSKDGSYIQIDDSPGFPKTTTTGKWKLINSGGKVRLFDNKTDAPNSIIGDHDWKITKKVNDIFMSYSSLDSQFAPETTIYKKIK